MEEQCAYARALNKINQYSVYIKYWQISSSKGVEALCFVINAIIPQF